MNLKMKEVEVISEASGSKEFEVEGR